MIYNNNMSIGISGSKERIADFLSKQATCVLASADKNGKPHAATVYFTCDRQLNFYFVTKKETQKNRNLQANPQAAIAVSDIPSQTTVQAFGTVIEVSEPSRMEWIFNDIWRLAALTTSNIAPPPTTKLVAGGYVVYQLSAPTIRIARFNRPDNSESDLEHIFEVVDL